MRKTAVALLGLVVFLPARLSAQDLELPLNTWVKRSPLKGGPVGWGAAQRPIMSLMFN